MRPRKRKVIQKQPHLNLSLLQSNRRQGQPGTRPSRSRKRQLQLPLGQKLIPLLMDPRGRKVADRLPLSLGRHGQHNLRVRPPLCVLSMVALVEATIDSEGLIDLLKSVLLENHRQVIAVAGELLPVLLVDLLVMNV